MSQAPKTPGESRYPHLFSPLRVGNITIRNRLMQTAHAKGFHAADGLTNNRDIYYQAERAKGGAGLLVTGARHVHPQSTGPSRTLARGNRAEAAGQRLIGNVQMFRKPVKAAVFVRIA